jgi:hypothetical protein
MCAMKNNLLVLEIISGAKLQLLVPKVQAWKQSEAMEVVYCT